MDRLRAVRIHAGQVIPTNGRRIFGARDSTRPECRWPRTEDKSCQHSATTLRRLTHRFGFYGSVGKKTTATRPCRRVPKGTAAVVGSSRTKTPIVITVKKTSTTPSIPPISSTVGISRACAMTFSSSVVRLCTLLTFASIPSASAWTAGPASFDARVCTTTSSTSLYHAPKNAPKHDVGGDPFASLSPDQKERAQAYMGHQQNVPKPGFPTDVRSLVQYNHGFAVMSTNSKANPGFPGGSVVGFAPDDQGRPLFVFSGMSSHTQDLLADPRCSLTVAAKEFKGAADGRVNLMGTCERLKDPEEIAAAKEIYLAKHPGAFWVEFGDFFWYRQEVEQIRFVGGFARAGSVTAEEYKEATPDPIMAFGGHVAQHMNDDHMDATIAMVKHYIPGLDAENYVQAAEITSVDSLGMYVKITRDPENDDQLPGQPKQFKLRLPFPRAVTERKDVKMVIVEMTQASAPAPVEEETAEAE